MLALVPRILSVDEEKRQFEVYDLQYDSAPSVRPAEVDWEELTDAITRAHLLPEEVMVIAGYSIDSGPYLYIIKDVR